MAIPKTIYQTYKSAKLPLVTQWHIKKMLRKNPEYHYEFYDDERLDSFIKKSFDDETYQLFNRINIGATKADIFRYAILYKKGGVYLDIDSRFLHPIDQFILPTDEAVIAPEFNPLFYIQYALFFQAGHPFLAKTLDIIFDNLKNNKHPYDTHAMTGPAPFTEAIHTCLAQHPQTFYRKMNVDYDGNVQFSYRGSKFFLYGINRKNHWKKLRKTTPILNGDL